MKYKLLCTDMDGTLLSDGKNISDRTIKAIKAANEKGVKIAICTGRVFTSAYYYADLLEIKAPVIASNGAYIREKDRDDVIYKNVLNIDQCKKILDIAKKYGFYIHFNTCEGILTEELSHSSAFYQKLNETLPENMRINIEIVEDWNMIFEKYDGSVVKGVIVEEDREKIKGAREELIKLDEFEIASSWANNFEIMNKGVSKGKAVEILADFYKIDREEIICIGDNENDISMLKFAGLGVAMGNAEDYVKAQANYVTDANDDHGVAKVIEKFILN